MSLRVMVIMVKIVKTSIISLPIFQVDFNFILSLVDITTGSQQDASLESKRNLVETAGRARRTNSGILGYSSIFNSFRFGQSQLATYIDILEIRM